MKITVTGSLGHIGRPLTQELVEKGHEITVISSQPERQQEIEALGAKAAIGSLEDNDFLTEAFKGADAVYTMVPPNNYQDHSLDLFAYYPRLGNNYAGAIKAAGVKRVVNLSSIGAHMSEGNGILVGAYKVEGILNALPEDVVITHMRPTSFYYNLYGFIPLIKSSGIMAANYGGEDVMPWVSPKDIAAAIAEELTTPQQGRKVRYVCSEEATCNETARTLGEAIGKPDLKWVLISDEEMAGAMKHAGMNPQIADGLTEMYAALHSGALAEDYYRNRPVMGKVKLADFAKDFAAAYQQ